MIWESFKAHVCVPVTYMENWYIPVVTRMAVDALNVDKHPDLKNILCHRFKDLAADLGTYLFLPCLAGA